MAWTPPNHVIPAQGWPAATINEEVIDNIIFLHDGVPMFACECDDISQTVVPTANRGYAVPLIPRDKITIDGITFRSQTANGNISVAVYEDDDNGTSATQLATSGSVAMPSSGAQTVAFTVPSQVLDSFQKYWLAISFSSSSARALGTDGPYSLLCKYMASAHPLPSTFTFGGTPPIAPCLAGLSADRKSVV